MSQKERCPAAGGEDLRVQIQGLKSRQDLNLRVGEVVGKGKNQGVKTSTMHAKGESEC